ncbi:MAG: T9SS type A sorting domain-containing protein [Flavobacteriales bacterium]|nr:T9SS type A sorting domain-containing protein [Flavobacteriales bacterium]
MRIREAMLGVALAMSALTASAQTSSQRAAVQLSATVQASPARITLAWTSIASTTSITIYRKLKTATSWGSVLATPATSALTYADNTASVGTAYEYKVVRVAGGVTGTGYICAGIEVSPIDYRGKLLLLVDNTFSTSLSAELTTLRNDLRADGWAVVRTDLARTASVASVRNTIIAQYNADPANVKAVFIIGHLAVPYSGNINPDGHSEHLGAWPCDGYYGELNGTWTDATVNNAGASRTENRNIPGDGKFDQSAFPNALELQVGRVDMYDMPAFSLNETELTRSYLNKLHGFKMKYWTPTARGLVFDNLQWVSNPLAASAWRNIPALVGAANTTAANQGGTLFHQLVDDQSYLWTYSSGGGLQAYVGSTLTYNGADRVGTTQDFATTSSTGGVFNMSFGSYFGDWDNKNNFLRAPLASGYALTNCWAAIPAWYFHHMSLGENIGYSTLTSMNNTSLYTPLTDGWQSTMGKTHLALMGDPSLRLKYLVAPSNLTVSNSGGVASFSWNPATETVSGYHLYRVDGSTGAITRLTNSLVTATTYMNVAIPYAANMEYMVRAVKLQTEPSGSYYNLSLGAFYTTPAGAVADCLGVSGGSALPGTPCNDGNPCTINDTWTTGCQCVGTAMSVSTALTAAGPTSFCTGGSVVLSAATGTGYSYVWYRNGTIISGAASSSYTATLAGNYTAAIASNGCTTTTTAATVTVSSVPAASITAGGSTTFCGGGSVTLTTGTGTGYTYAWKRNGTTISGATANSYSATQAGSYTVTITSGGCSSTSAATTVTVTGAPTATITAASATGFCTGGSTVLSANTGTGYAYTWKRNGSTISGATSSNYTATLAGSYTVTIGSGGCSTTSAATTVTVNALPTATISVSATSICPGNNALISASTGTGYTYTWKRNGTVISGATQSTYAATTAGSYTVTVSNGGCSATSTATVISMLSAPVVSSSASPATGTVSATATGGAAPYSYLWNTVPAQTTATANVTTSGSYTVTVNGSNGCSTTSTVAYTSAAAATCTGMHTEAQGSWGSSNSLQSAYMTANFTAGFTSPNYLTIGCGTRLMRFTSAQSIITALPTYGTTNLLPAGTSVNPTSPGNTLVGQLVSAKLNVRFDELDAAFSPSGILLKNMVVASGTYAGWTVQQVINAADQAIGGCTTTYSRSSLSSALTAINNGYDQPGENSGYLICPGTSGMILEPSSPPSMVTDDMMDALVFPNPTSGATTILLTSGDEAQEIEIDLYSITGAWQVALYTGTVEAGMQQRVDFDASSYPAGAYYCTIRQGDRSQTLRLMIER